MPKTAVLIACYNEAPNIKKTIEGFRAALPEADIYVYDNNSTDGSADIAQAAGAIVVPEYRQGKGNVIRSMFRDVDADIYILADGDDPFPQEQAPAMAQLVAEGKADLVIGGRSNYAEQQKRAFHGLGNRLVSGLINRIFKGNIQDIMSGFRALSRSFVKSFPVLSRGFEIETEMTIHALDRNMLVREVPVIFRERPDGSPSKLNTFRDGLKVIKTIFSLYRDYKPFSFFGYISAALAVAGLGAFVPVLIDWIQHNGVLYRFPTLFVSGFLMLAAMLSLACGMILATLRKNNRQAFEIQLTQLQYLEMIKSAHEGQK
ncbi:MAG: glycosyltransferase family 2 protein [Clostridia bacterium]|nr:glycosyltransferase family 2 protein [Clostridia bacterium]